MAYLTELEHCLEKAVYCNLLLLQCVIVAD